jgi:hypothetical protein
MQIGSTQRNTLDRDSFLLGLVVGTAFPVMVYGILLTLYDWLEIRLLASDVGMSPDFRFRTLMLVAICANLLPFNIYRRWSRDNTMRGMVLPTMGFVVYWFWVYGRHMVGL